MLPLQIFGVCKLQPNLLYHVTHWVRTPSKIHCLKHKFGQNWDNLLCMFRTVFHFRNFRSSHMGQPSMLVHDTWTGKLVVISFKLCVSINIFTHPYKKNTLYLRVHKNDQAFKTNAAIANTFIPGLSIQQTPISAVEEVMSFLFSWFMHLTTIWITASSIQARDNYLKAWIIITSNLGTLCGCPVVLVRGHRTLHGNLRVHEF